MLPHGTVWLAIVVLFFFIFDHFGRDATEKVQKRSSRKGTAAKRPKCPSRVDYVSQARDNIRHDQGLFKSFVDQQCSIWLLMVSSKQARTAYMNMKGRKKEHVFYKIAFTPTPSFYWSCPSSKYSSLNYDIEKQIYIGEIKIIRNDISYS